MVLFGARSPLAPRARFQVRGFLFPHESQLERIYPKPEGPVLLHLISLLRRLLSLLRVRGSGFGVSSRLNKLIKAVSGLPRTPNLVPCTLNKLNKSIGYEVWGSGFRTLYP